MADYLFTYYPDNPPGERLAPELRTEIQLLAPSTLNDSAVSTPKLQDESVTNAKLGLDAVHSENILDGEVKAPNLAAQSVTTAKLADNAVTPPKAGQGIVTCEDKDGTYLAMKVVPISATDWAAIPTPSPDVAYFVLET